MGSCFSPIVELVQGRPPCSKLVKAEKSARRVLPIPNIVNLRAISVAIVSRICQGYQGMSFLDLEKQERYAVGGYFCRHCIDRENCTVVVAQDFELKTDTIGDIDL